MTKESPRIGSSFESPLDESGIRAEAVSAATKAVTAERSLEEMKKENQTKKRPAELMHTSRAQLDKVFDPDNGSATIESLVRAARIVGREVRVQLV